MKRNFKRNFISNGGGSAQMLNNSNLQDLDRELELLRRKRQMLESQFQQGGFNRPNPWDQPPRINEYSAPRAFNQPKYVDQYESPRRPHATSWQEPAAKRFRQGFDSRSAPHTFQAQRPQQYPPPKTYKPTTNVAGPKRAKGFVNPKPTPAPKPAAQPPPKLNKSAPKLPNTDPKPARYLDFVVSEANEPFPPVVKGRMESVLGDLFRGIKERAEDKESNVLEISRQVKRVLRDRIRAAMRDKPLGTKQNIAAQYAEAHPDNDDAEIIRLATLLQTKEVMDKGVMMDTVEPENNPLLTNIITTADSPEQYFLQNMEIVIGTKMDEMFNKIQNLYEEDADPVKDLIQKVDEISKEAQTKNAEAASEQNGAEKDENPTTDVPATEDSEAKPENENVEATAESVEGEEANGTAEATENGAEATENGAEATENGAEANGAASRDEYYSTLLNTLIRRELPKLLPNYKNYLVKMLSMDVNYSKAQKSILEHAAKVQKSTSNNKPGCYVMILGEPQLPRKERLQTFLNKFNPASIKKHKRVHNVLYIGFKDKNDLDRIIAEDGLILANMKLIIKENKNYRDNPLKILNGAAKLIPKTALQTGPGNTDSAAATEIKTEEPDTTEVKTEELDTSQVKTEEPDTSQVKTEEPDTSEVLNSSGAKEPAEDEKSLIDSDIDGQINDLFSSISKADDENSSVDAVQANENAPENEAEGNVALEPQAEENNDATEMVDEDVTGEANNGVEASEGTANGEEKASTVTKEAKDASEVAKTPIRASTRLAGGIMTRRASRLAQ